MIRHQFTLACDMVIRNADDETMSAITIYEDINAAAFPVVMPRLNFLTLVERDVETDPAEVQCTVRLTIDGETIVEGPLVVNFLDKRRARQIAIFQPLIVPRPGTMRYEILREAETLGFYEMTFRTMLPIEEPTSASH